MSDLIRTYTLPVATLLEYPTYIHTTLVDGFEQHYHPPLTAAAFLAAVAEMGYSDPMRYAVEHEIAHHLMADWFPAAERVMPIFEPQMMVGSYSLDEAMGYQPVPLPCSRIIFNACHDLPQSMDEPESAAEEHLANRLMRYANLGATDPYGVLEQTCGLTLPAFASEYLLVCRPWVKR